MCKQAIDSNFGFTMCTETRNSGRGPWSFCQRDLTPKTHSSSHQMARREILTVLFLSMAVLACASVRLRLSSTSELLSSSSARCLTLNSQRRVNTMRRTHSHPSPFISVRKFPSLSPSERDNSIES